MKRTMRVCSAAALSAVAGLGLALPASAAVTPTPSACQEQSDGYSSEGVCQLTVEILTPVCDNDVPYLTYKVTAEGTPSTKMTMTWTNPTGADVVYSDLPLSGKVPWPGAVQGSDGKGADWPGWTKLADGTWVEGDEYDWVRPSVSVTLAVNPQVTTTVAYPPSSPVCLTSPPSSSVLAAPASTTASGVLAATGAEPMPWLVAGGALVLAGGALVGARAVSRRRA